VTSTLPALVIRSRLGLADWAVPTGFGPDGWLFRHRQESGQIIVTCAPYAGIEWVHASIGFADRMPTYGEIKNMHHAVYPEGWAYEVFAPPAEHVNIHDYVRHLFGRLDRKPYLPDFTRGTGSI